MNPGIHWDCDVAKYHALEPKGGYALTQSRAKRLLEASPAHVIHEIKHPELKEYKSAQAIGDAAHSLMLGRGKNIAIGKFDDWRTKEAKAFRKNALAKGKTPLIQAHYDRANDICRVGTTLLARHEERDCFRHGKAEVALVWQEDDILFRCLVDWLRDDLRGADDYKTTGLSIAEHNLGRLAADAGWHIQAAMIERGLNALDPENVGRRQFRFVAQEQEPPHLLQVFRMDEYWLTMGRKQLQAAVDIWRACSESDNWYGYPLCAVTPQFPGWRESQWLNRELEQPNILMAG